MSRKAADAGRTKSGKFSADPTMRDKMCKSIIDQDMDWTSTGGKIWVRCWETPKEFTLVEADVVWTSPIMRVR